MEGSILKQVLQDPNFTNYLFYTSILVLKMMVMTLLTIRQRIVNKAFVSEEDEVYLFKTFGLKGKVSWSNEKVERVRRGHQNDLENIYLFFIISLCYICTNPNPYVTDKLFAVYTIARIIHTVVYTVFVIPQPIRGLAWLAGFVVTGYMAMSIIAHVWYI